MKKLFTCVLFFPTTLSAFSQKIKVESVWNDKPDSTATEYADSLKTIAVGTADFYYDNHCTDSLCRPFKIVHYKNGYDTAFYANRNKIGYHIDKNRGDQIHPQWLSLATLPRGYTFGIGYHRYNKKQSYFEAYVGIFGMLYSNSVKIFSTGANYTYFFYRKEKKYDLYHAVLVDKHKQYIMNSALYHQTKIDLVKNIHWGFQTGFSYDNVNGERATSYFSAANQSIQLLHARSFSAVAGLSRFVVKCMQLSFGPDGERKLRGANFRRLSFAIAYYPFLDLKWQQVDEGILLNDDKPIQDAFYGNRIGWKVIWDGRLAFWGRKDFGIVYRYGIEQTPFRQYGRNGLVPILCGGVFFDVGKKTMKSKNEVIDIRMKP